MERAQAADTAALKKAFTGGRGPYSPYIYLPLDEKRDLTRREKISKLFVGYRSDPYNFWFYEQESEDPSHTSRHLYSHTIAVLLHHIA